MIYNWSDARTDGWLDGWMECNAVEWNGMDAFWVILTLLVILGPNLVVFVQKRKKVNSSTRRRQRHPTSLKKYLFEQKSNQHFHSGNFALIPILATTARTTLILRFFFDGPQIPFWLSLMSSNEPNELNGPNMCSNEPTGHPMGT